MLIGCRRGASRPISVAVATRRDLGHHNVAKIAESHHSGLSLPGSISEFQLSARHRDGRDGQQDLLFLALAISQAPRPNPFSSLLPTDDLDRGRKREMRLTRACRVSTGELQARPALDGKRRQTSQMLVSFIMRGGTRSICIVRLSYLEQPPTQDAWCWSLFDATKCSRATSEAHRGITRN